MPPHNAVDEVALKNDGMHPITYDFSDDDALNQRLSDILDASSHDFGHHADGNWKRVYKPKYARQLAEHIGKQPSLTRKRLKLKDPLIGNITHAAIALEKTG